MDRLKMEQDFAIPLSNRSRDLNHRSTPFQDIVISILVLTVFSLVVYAVTLSFDVIAAVGAVLISAMVVIVNPKVLERIENQHTIHYYCLIIVISIFFSIELCKSNNELIILAITAVGVTVLNLYAENRMIAYLSMFLNLYVLIRIAVLMPNC